MGRSEIAAITPAKQQISCASRWILASMLAFPFGGVGAQVTPPSAADGKPSPSLSYDVATIRESGPDANGNMMVRIENPPHVAQLRSQNFVAEQLVQIAYGLEFYQTEGGTDWSRNVPLIVQARSDDTTTEILAKLSDNDAKLAKQQMLQNLLADRFQLKVHWITKVMPLYSLTVAKSGPKLERSDPAKDAGEKSWPQESCYNDGCHIVARNAPLANLAAMLTGQCGAEVQDKTGLTGAYNFKLAWHGTFNDLRPEDPSGPQLPSLPTALQDQLGLKLEAAKGPVKVLVIDYIAKPSPN